MQTNKRATGLLLAVFVAAAPACSLIAGLDKDFTLADAGSDAATAPTGTDAAPSDDAATATPDSSPTTPPDSGPSPTTCDVVCRKLILCNPGAGTQELCEQTICPTRTEACRRCIVDAPDCPTLLNDCQPLCGS